MHKEKIEYLTMLVQEVKPESSAEKILLPGDEIMAINGADTTSLSFKSLKDLIKGFHIHSISLDALYVYIS